MLTAYWHSRGHTNVVFYLAGMYTHRFGEMVAIRSNLVNGLPPYTITLEGQKSW